MLDMFRVSPRVPRVYTADGLSSAAWVQGIIETGWVNSNPRLGAPFGQAHYDYPLGGDNLHFLMMRALSLVTGDWVLIVNLFFLATFATAAFSAYLAQRWLGVGRLLGAVVALVFAFLPYHFVRGPEHLLLSSYFVVPIATVLAAQAYSGLPPYDEWPSWRSVAMACSIVPWIFAVLVVGSCGAYYAVFAVLLIGVAALLGSATARSTSPLLAGAVASVGIGATLVGNLVGSIRFRRANGANALVAERAAIELDSYPLPFADLVTPLRETRWPGLGTLAEKATLPMASSTGQYQGLIGATCLVALAVWLVAGRGARGLQPGTRMARGRSRCVPRYRDDGRIGLVGKHRWLHPDSSTQPGVCLHLVPRIDVGRPVARRSSLRLGPDRSTTGLDRALWRSGSRRGCLVRPSSVTGHPRPGCSGELRLRSRLLRRYRVEPRPG